MQHYAMWFACVTHVALEGLLSGVCAHVFIQTTLLTEGLVALAAFIRLLLDERERETDRNTAYCVIEWGNLSIKESWQK